MLAKTTVTLDPNLSTKNNKIICAFVTTEIKKSVPVWDNIGKLDSNKCKEVIGEWNRVKRIIDPHEARHVQSFVSWDYLRKLHTLFLNQPTSDYSTIYDGILANIDTRQNEDHAKFGGHAAINTFIECPVRNELKGPTDYRPASNSYPSQDIRRDVNE